VDSHKKRACPHYPQPYDDGDDAPSCGWGLLIQVQKRITINTASSGTTFWGNFPHKQREKVNATCVGCCRPRQRGRADGTELGGQHRSVVAGVWVTTTMRSPWAAAALPSKVPDRSREVTAVWRTGQGTHLPNQGLSELRQAEGMYVVPSPAASAWGVEGMKALRLATSLRKRFGRERKPVRSRPFARTADPQTLTGALHLCDDMDDHSGKSAARFPDDGIRGCGT